MSYVHIDIHTVQTSYHRGAPCGDVIRSFRLPECTYIVFADGCGHGVQAHITATYIAEKLITLLAEGRPLRSAFTMVINTIQQSKGRELPYAALTALKILNDGETTALTYEMPLPIFTATSSSEILHGRTLTIKAAIITESYCFLEPGDSLIVMSDGITDAGFGVTAKNGWTIEKVRDYINSHLSSGKLSTNLARAIHDKARELWGQAPGDDCSVMQCFCRPGQTATVLTGPPADKKLDGAVTERFLRAEGVKIICGASTAKMVSDRLGKELSIDPEHGSMLAPPKYLLEGIDLATEGAVTLNQVYNIIDEDETYYEENSGVTDLCLALREADGITFILGRAHNTGHEHIGFRQRGILPRQIIVPKIAEKLRNMGKMVVIKET